MSSTECSNYFMENFIKLDDYNSTTESSSYESDNDSYYNSSDMDDSDEQQENNLDLTNDIINKYNIITELGRGAYSIVWLGYSIDDGKYYAIKVQNPDDYSEGKDEIKMLKKISKSQIYINRLVDSFIEERFLDEKLVKYVCSVYELCCGNLDALARKGKFKNGYPIPIVKKMLYQLCVSLKYLHDELKIFHGDIKPDNILLVGINNRDKKYMDMYSKVNFRDNYSLVKRKYWLKKNNDIKNIKKMDPLQKIKIRKTLHESMLEKIDKNEESCYLFDDKYIDLDRLQIKLTDFGHYCPDEEKFEEEFGTRYYQAPEIILMGDCRKYVDIWALGCSLYELLTGDFLFDPHGDKECTTDYYHLEMMIDLCGNFSKSCIRETKYYKSFFDRKGRLQDKKFIKTESIEEQLKRKLIKRGLKEDKDLENIVDLLSKMLILTPSKRISSREILGHPFLSNL